MKETNSSFYRVAFDSRLNDCTYFDEPKTVTNEVLDWWHFSNGREWNGRESLKVTAYRTGRLYDISMAPGDIPYVTRRVVDIFKLDRSLSDSVQFIPLAYGESTIHLMNILPVISCIDEIRTESVMLWKEEDGEPEKVGEYRQVIGLRVDPDKLQDVDICRVRGWEVAIIVSRRLKLMLEAHLVTGVEFWPA
jgi:hypothetical protein